MCQRPKINIDRKGWGNPPPNETCKILEGLGMRVEDVRHDSNSKVVYSWGCVPQDSGTVGTRPSNHFLLLWANLEYEIRGFEIVRGGLLKISRPLLRCFACGNTCRHQETYSFLGFIVLLREPTNRSPRWGCTSFVLSVHVMPIDIETVKWCGCTAMATVETESPGGQPPKCYSRPNSDRLHDSGRKALTSFI